MVEKIWWGMPTYEDKGELCSFASQRLSMSLYIYDAKIVEKYAPRLRPLSIGKVSIRFKTISELPLDLVKKMLLESKNHR